MTFVFNGLRKQGCTAIPVTGIDRDQQYREAVRDTVTQDGRGVCVRLRLEQAAKGNLKTSLDALLTEVGIGSDELDLVLDLGAPNFIPLEGFTKLVESIVLKMPYVKHWRSFTVLGSSFPRTMAEVKGSVAVLQRCEWLFFKRLIQCLRDRGVRRPTFGDYAVQHPDALQLDMRKVRPAASIRYAMENSWYIAKGANVRDNGFEQYRTLCAALVASSYYAGRDYSAGDAYIQDCAKGLQGTGNLTTWRWVGTNHHLTRITGDIASLFSSSGTP